MKMKLPKLTAQEMEWLRSLADCDLNLAWAARCMKMRRTTLQSRLGRIFERTGLNPLNFYDLHELLYLEVDND